MKSEQRKDNRSDLWEKEENGIEIKKLKKRKNMKKWKRPWNTEEDEERKRKILDQEIKKKKNYYREVKWTGESRKGGTNVRKKIIIRNYSNHKKLETHAGQPSVVWTANRVSIATATLS